MKHYHLPQLLHEYVDCTVEACMRCGQRFTFYKNSVTGRLQDYGWQELKLEDGSKHHIKVHGDNYAEVHARDFLQPTGATKMDYIQEYGYEAYERSMKTRLEQFETKEKKAKTKEDLASLEHDFARRKMRRSGDLFYT